MTELEPPAAWVGPLLLGVALVFNLLFLSPELHVSRAPLNDHVLHLVASERIGEALAAGEPFLDPWLSESSLGYPFWRSYQPLPHLVAAGWMRLVATEADPADAFAAFHYATLVTLPASIYGGARLLSLSPAAAGLAALLVLAPSAGGDLDRYGIGYGATTWRGSGLFTQLAALHFLAWAIGALGRTLDHGRRPGVAAMLLAATALSHIVFAYVAIASGVVLAIVGPAGARARRLARLAIVLGLAGLLVAWFVAPLFLSRGEINHSRWEDAYKWDSFGAAWILRELVSGRFLDAGRFPVLTASLGVGAAAALASWRDPMARRLLALAATWLVLFFGRETWGHLLLLAGVPGDLHLHRLQGAFELSAVLLAAWGITRLTAAISGWGRAAGGAVAGVAAAGILVLGLDRGDYLRTNAAWGETNLVAVAAREDDLRAALSAARAIVDERPGRVSAGKAAEWGRDFRVGSVPVYAFLARERFDQASFLYHSMSRTSEVMVLRDEDDPAHHVAFGVRAVVAPAERAMPPHLRLRARHGPFAVYEASAEGYFGLVDVGAAYEGPREGAYDVHRTWLASTHLRNGIVAAIDDDGRGVPPDLPRFGRWDPIPPPVPGMLRPRGRIAEERASPGTWQARIELERPAYAYLKVTYHPDLVATVDGKSASLLRVTPGFAAIPVPAGRHDVVVRWAPGLLKPALFALGSVTFLAFAIALRSRRFDAAAARLADGLAPFGERLLAPRTATALLLVAATLVAMRPLFRGQLVDGHDALEYPPRLVEFAKVVGEGHVPPVWAPDLGNGHGQPLFGFAPPLVYAAALPFHWIGLGLTDSLQVALALLHLAGAIAVYRFARRSAPRPAALGGAIAWLFVPYVSLDLYVRAAFAEASAVAVAPLALLGVARVADRPTARRVATGALLVALVPLAHNAAALLLLPALGLFALAAARSLRALAGSGVTLAAGLGASALFWIPAWLETKYVKVELLRSDFLQWSEHAVSPWQLLWSPWGYGLSGAGTGDGMSFAIGPVHLALAAIGIAFAWRAGERRREVAALAAIALGGAWLATTASAAVWSHVEPLQYLAYPWRALLLPALALPLLAVPAFARFGRPALVVAILLVAGVNLPHTAAKGHLTFDDEYYAPESIARRGINTTTREEYEPRWVERRPPFFDAELVGVDAPISLEPISVASTWRKVRVNAPSPTRVDTRVFYYPGWEIEVDGVLTAAEPAPGTGTMRFRLDAGRHDVTLRFRPTPARRYALAASIVTVAVLAFALAASRAFRKRGGA